MRLINSKIVILILFPLLFCFAVLAEDITKPKLERHFVFETTPLNLQEIIQASGKIFTGRCLKVEEIENDPESNLEVVNYRFKVIEGIRGVKDNSEISFKQWKPTVRNASYEVGKKYVLFLYPKSNKGLTSPVGLSQGLFDIGKKGFIRKKEVVKNKLGNRGLARNLKTQQRVLISQDKYINDYIYKCSEFGVPMRYQEFIKAVKYLASE